MKTNAFHFTWNIVKILPAVDVAKNAVPNSFLFHQLENVHGTTVIIERRVMEYANDLLRAAFFCQFNAPKEPALLPLQDGGIIGCKFPGGFRNPAPCTGKGDISDLNTVVVEKFKGPVGGPRHFRHRIPPVVVIAADDDFSSWKSGDPFKIRHSLREIVAPGEVACNDYRIFWCNGFHPGFVNFFFVVFPNLSENIHGFCGRIPGEVEIAECVQFHLRLNSFII